MKNKNLIARLKKLPPDLEVIFWDGQDNWDINDIDLDPINRKEIVLKY